MSSTPPRSSESDVSSDFSFAVETQIAEMRSAYKLNDESPMEVSIPHHEAERLIRQHGSLDAASAYLFGSSVRIVDAYWSEFCATVMTNVNVRLSILFDRGYFTQRKSTSDYTQGVVVPKWVKQNLTAEQVTQLEESGAVFI